MTIDHHTLPAVLPPDTEGMKATDFERKQVEVLMTEGPWPEYGQTDLIRALRIGYALGLARGRSVKS
ncbi:MAG: hypothetical protein ACRD0W_00930 [Acidimicrobiales bacterium]